MPDPESLLAMMIFGAIGMGAFMYGKNRSDIRVILLGILLMGYPYFVSGVFLMWGVGIAICAVLYSIREK